MVFQIPGAYDSAYVALMLAREDVVATVAGALMSALAATLAVALAIFLFAFDTGSIALRLPLMAVATLAAMYASRAFKIGPAAFIGGFILVKAQTFADQSSTTEELVHITLWGWVMVGLPVAVVILVQLATGERPAARARRSALRLLRALADSLRTPGARDLTERLADAFDLLASTRRNAMVDAAAKGRLGSDLRLMETLETLLLMEDVLPAEVPLSVRRRLADECDACANGYERGEPPAPQRQPSLADTTSIESPEGAVPAVRAMAVALGRLREGLDRRARGLVEPMSHAAPPRMTDVAERRANVQFAVKSTLAVMSAYLIYTGFGYQEIATAVTTCFFVSLGSLGESVQKLNLRLSGALVGGIAAGLCIAFIRPSMTDIGQLSLLIGAGAGICAWVAASSVRLSYMGMQMAFAFFHGILQGYAPPSHFRVLWDRVIGILLGNVIVAVVFSTVWPTSARDRERASIAQALDGLAAFVGARAMAGVGSRLEVLEAINKARQFDAFATFELRMLPKTTRPESRQEMTVAELQRIAGLVFVTAELPGSPAVADRLRGENERAAELLRASARTAGVPSEVRPHAEVPVVEGATLADRAALEASAGLLSELERARGVAP
jgi:multidrug resistance protein MdtO